MSYKEKLRESVLSAMCLDREPEDDTVLRLIDNCIREEAGKYRIPLKEMLSLRQELFHSLRKLDLLSELLEDETVTEIMINGYANIFVEREGRLERLPKAFASEEKLRDVVQQVVSACNRIVNEAHPVVDARLPDGSRVNVVLPPVALNGAVMTIRRFPKEPITMERLTGMGSLTKQAAKLLSLLVKSGYNIFISGGTGSGKTTFLNALSSYIPTEDRVITIEDAAELQLQDIPNLVRLEARDANVEGENAVTIKDLIKASLRMRPTRLIVGEVRDGAALDMLTAMNTGHDGSLSTGHANSAPDMLRRLETMVLMAVDMPISAIRSQIASAIDLVIHLGRLRDKRRCVLEVSEVLGVKGDAYELRTLFRFEEDKQNGSEKQRELSAVTSKEPQGKLSAVTLGKPQAKRDTVAGSLVMVQGLKCTQKLKREGYYEAYKRVMGQKAAEEEDQ